jgi:rubrerythrin
MSTANPMQNILRTAIQREIDANTLYSRAAEMVKTPHAAAMLKELAAQEVGHRNKLEGLLAGKTSRVLSKVDPKKVQDLKITDYLIEVPLAADSDLQDILIVAGKREKGSYDLYTALAQVAGDAEIVKLFEFLASEEATHKHRVEALYEEIVLKDN